MSATVSTRGGAGRGGAVDDACVVVEVADEVDVEVDVDGGGEVDVDVGDEVDVEVDVDVEDEDEVDVEDAGPAGGEPVSGRGAAAAGGGAEVDVCVVVVGGRVNARAWGLVPRKATRELLLELLELLEHCTLRDGCVCRANNRVSALVILATCARVPTLRRSGKLR